MNDKSFKEGTGGSARFNKPQFGVFVKNEKYGEGIGPDKDQYDFYFVTEKITASGSWTHME